MQQPPTGLSGGGTATTEHPSQPCPRTDDRGAPLSGDLGCAGLQRPWQAWHLRKLSWFLTRGGGGHSPIRSTPRGCSTRREYLPADLRGREGKSDYWGDEYRPSLLLFTSSCRGPVCCGAATFEERRTPRKCKRKEGGIPTVITVRIASGGSMKSAIIQCTINGGDISQCCPKKSQIPTSETPTVAYIPNLPP